MQLSIKINRRSYFSCKSGFIVAFGLKPTKPETGFGYVQIKGNEVISFREKPNLETAQEFLEAGNFYWNSGMFCFKAGVFRRIKEISTRCF